MPVFTHPNGFTGSRRQDYLPDDSPKSCAELVEACLPFPLSGDTTLMKGIPRNFEVYDPLDFLAEVTQHIPNKGEHQIRYYGFYSNKMRGLQLKKMHKPEQTPGIDEPDTPDRRKCRMTWAALIKCVFEAMR